MDPFEDVKERLYLLVKLNPQITARELLQTLQQQEEPDKKDNLRRTLQRRLREWRYELSAAGVLAYWIDSVILLESTNVNRVTSVESMNI